MKVTLDKVFPLDASADSAWQLLQDIETVAGCMPGAKITERVDQTHYKGTITVRLGPATMAFKGELEVLNLDLAARSLHMVGKGTDATGSSAASMDLAAAVRVTDGACELAGKSEVTMSGKAAALGGRLMAPVADQMLKQFVANFTARLQQAAGAAAQQPGEAAGPPGSQAAASASAAASPDGAAPRNELNGLALAWAIVRDWLRGLFSRKTA